MQIPDKIKTFRFALSASRYMDNRQHERVVYVVLQIAEEKAVEGD